LTTTTSGGGGAAGLFRETVELEVRLSDARDVIDERTGKQLGDGNRFTFPFDGVEPVFFSFAEPG
jgi:hypothetical protein